MRRGPKADHGECALKEPWASPVKAAGDEAADVAAHAWTAGEDYPLFVVLPAGGQGRRRVGRGSAVRGGEGRLSGQGVHQP
jgi:hypothetical protein